ncbi:MAG TPA: hypothetical protein VF452_09635 [Candidatus Binatia bacterium]
MFMEANLSRTSYQEIAASLFQPDPLIVDQHSDTFRRNLYLQPEKRLMLAVLEDAIFCFKKFMPASDRKKKALFHDAEDWIFRKNDDYAFSFETICEALGLDSEYLRAGLRRWKEIRCVGQQSVEAMRSKKLP